jgi:hypothetical protein
MDKDKIYIECECGTHILQVTNDIEYFDDTITNRKRVRQEFSLAMFSYDNSNEKPSFWRKLGIAWNYMKTSKMHADQLLLHPDEAQKLIDFLNENIVPTEKG